MFTVWGHIVLSRFCTVVFWMCSKVYIGLDVGTFSAHYGLWFLDTSCNTCIMFGVSSSLQAWLMSSTLIPIPPCWCSMYYATACDVQIDVISLKPSCQTCCPHITQVQVHPICATSQLTCFSPCTFVVLVCSWHSLPVTSVWQCASWQLWCSSISSHSPLHTKSQVLMSWRQSLENQLRAMREQGRTQMAKQWGMAVAVVFCIVRQASHRSHQQLDWLNHDSREFVACEEKFEYGTYVDDNGQPCVSDQYLTLCVWQWSALCGWQLLALCGWQYLALCRWQWSALYGW